MLLQCCYTISDLVQSFGALSYAHWNNGENPQNPIRITNLQSLSASRLFYVLSAVYGYSIEEAGNKVNEKVKQGFVTGGEIQIRLRDWDIISEGDRR